MYVPFTEEDYINEIEKTKRQLYSRNTQLRETAFFVLVSLISEFNRKYPKSCYKVLVQMDAKTFKRMVLYLSWSEWEIKE